MKIKKIIALVLVLVMSLSALPVSASAATDKPEFEIDRNGRLYAYNGDGGDVVVPDGVIQIGDIFSRNDAITSLTIPEGCKKIGKIHHCANLTTLIFPYSAEYIDISKSSVMSMPSLRKIVIPNELTETQSGVGEITLRGTILIDENGKMTQAEPPSTKPDGLFKITLTVPQEFHNDRWHSDINYATKPGDFYVVNGKPYGDILKIGPSLPWENEFETYGKPITPLWKGLYWMTDSGKVVTPETIVDLTKDTVITLHHPEIDEKNKPVYIDDSMSSWAKAEIEAADAAGLVPDQLKSSFKSNITREEFCMLMIKLIEAKSGMNISKYVASKGVMMWCPDFRDASTLLYISPVYSLGIATGTSATTFNPNGTITNKEAADMFARAGMVLGISYSYSSSDPNGKLTREQAIVTALRMFNSKSNGQSTIPTFEDNQDNNQNQNNNQGTTANTQQQEAEAEWNRVKNSKGYSQHFYELNTEFLAKGVDPKYYEYTIVTDDIQAKSDEICAGLTTDLEKVTAIHAWVTESIYYDYPGKGHTSPLPAQTILENKRGVCSGYAILTQALCYAQGIPAVYVCGGTTNGYHAWNLVKLDGEWKWLDATWDTFNKYYGGNSWVDGSKRNDYFLCPTEFISKDHWVDVNTRTDGLFAINGINANLPSQSAQETQQLIKQEEERLKSDEYLKEIKKAVEKDGSMSSWAKAEIDEAAELGLVPGDIMNNFSNKITREEFCALMVKLVEANSGKDIASYVTSKGKTLSAPFTDTSSQEVKAAYALGIVNGVSATRFNPSGSITRQEAAAMLERTAKLLGLSSGSGVSFSDSGKIASWATGSVAFVSGLTDPVTGGKVMGGMGNGSFAPTGTYTREQAIATALRLIHCAG